MTQKIEIGLVNGIWFWIRVGRRRLCQQARLSKKIEKVSQPGPGAPTKHREVLGQYELHCSDALAGYLEGRDSELLSALLKTCLLSALADSGVDLKVSVIGKGKPVFPSNRQHKDRLMAKSHSEARDGLNSNEWHELC